MLDDKYSGLKENSNTNKARYNISALFSQTLEKALKEQAGEMIALSDKIEMSEPDGGTKEWMAFKRFRNTIRGKFSSKDN